MNQKQKDFLNKLADLCAEFKPDFFYTVQDDGIHIWVDADEIFVDFSVSAETLRKAADA